MVANPSVNLTRNGRRHSTLLGSVMDKHPSHSPTVQTLEASVLRLAKWILAALGVGTIALLLLALLGPEKFMRDVLIFLFLNLLLPVLTAVLGYAFGTSASSASERKIDQLEAEARANPEKSQLAWDAARSKLERYLDRNLNHGIWIFALTLLVMLCGFSFVVYGLQRALENPDRLPIAVVASASGVLISFIGGSFLLIYRSILGQAREYISVLERINAVGMALHVISNIPEEHADLKYQATAQIATRLLHSEVESPPRSRIKRKAAGPSA